MRFFKKIGEYSAVFTVGGLVYSFIEIVWRGFTHWTMALTGGFCLSAIYFIGSHSPSLAMWKKCIGGCTVITVSEFAVGMLVNRILKWNVWDYSGIPFNICGQICPIYTVLWFFLCVPAFFICGKIRVKFKV